MASIKILARPKAWELAKAVAVMTGATFKAEGEWLVISQEERLFIPRRAFERAYNPTGKAQDPRVERDWLALAMVREGYLESTAADGITITDEDPLKDERPQFHYRFVSAAQYEETKRLVKQTGHKSVTAYISWAIDYANASLKEGTASS